MQRNCAMMQSSVLAILVSGLPGSGKTYFAKRFAAAIGATYYSSDIVRKKLIAERSYSEDEKANVYIELEKLFSSALRLGKTVVIDATFIKRLQRDSFRKSALRCNSNVKFIEIIASEAVIRNRLSQPREDSEADWNVYQALSEIQEPIKLPHLTLSSDQNDVDTMIEEATNWLGISNDR